MLGIQQRRFSRCAYHDFLLHGVRNECKYEVSEIIDT